MLIFKSFFRFILIQHISIRVFAFIFFINVAAKVELEHMIIQHCPKICNGLQWISIFHKYEIQPLIYHIKSNPVSQILSREKNLKSFTMN